MRILVAGGAGYIGAHMCKCLHEAGHTVVVLDNLATGHRAAVKWGTLVEASVADTAVVLETLRSHRIDTVMHFAASSLVGESMAAPYAYYENNVSATLRLLQAMRASGVQRFVFSSTAAVYGQPRSDVIDENHPRDPINPYGRSKLAVELMLEDAARAYGLCVAALRYFNAAGAEPAAGIGESHQPETHLIPRLLRCAAGEALEVQIFGTDYPTPDGTCIRDYIHVTDLVDAHLRALEYITRQGGFHAFNLGNGEGYSVRQVVKAVEDVIGHTLDIPVGPRRAGDPAILVASSRKAREVLGWMPQYPDIRRIVADAWAWHRAPAY
ncbi:UDP-galactose 4-epimerase [Fontimonas thermophila]|uniref:UDP-glucose 4-epimerase n=1 Tax=Fontimonas thermophila TaxID=1076937 RepID=A0A1I2JJS4_9GAMM|nr:UDP-glucose 4-epimerase GalE [Fontimonas thermophila]SFF54509.1 UDP-galactose 4-epimerase [Fontimonas thermophila]